MTNETECECKTPFSCHQMGLCRAGKNSPIGGLHAMQKFQFADLSDAQAARIAEYEVRLRELEGERDRLEQRYQREVLGLNNEGDPIAGNPPTGWKRRAEAAEAKLAKAVACIEETVLGDLWPDIAEDRARATLASADLSDAQTARIAELEAAYQAARDETYRMAVTATEANARAEAAEAKLAKAEAYVNYMADQDLKIYEEYWDFDDGLEQAVSKARAVRDALAELKGIDQ